MQKLVFGLLLLLASSRTDADALCMTATSDPANQPPHREFEKIVAPPPVYPGDVVPEGSEGFVDVRFEITAAGNVREPVIFNSVPPGLFGDAALQGTLKFHYRPRIVDGKPVAVEGVETRLTFTPIIKKQRGNQIPAKQSPSQAQAVSKEVYDRIQLAQAQVDAKNLPAALRILDILLVYPMSDYERTNVLNYVGFVHYSMDNVPGAMTTYEELLLIPSLDAQMRKQTTYTLAQLNTMQEQYTNAIRLLEEYFVLATDPTAAAYILYAQNLYQLGHNDGIERVRAVTDHGCRLLYRAQAIGARDHHRLRL